MEFQFTELMSGESLIRYFKDYRPISTQLPPPLPKPPPNRSNKKAFCLFQDKNMKCSDGLPFKLKMGM